MILFTSNFHPLLRFIAILIKHCFINFKIAKTNDTLNSTTKSQGRVWQHLNIKETNGNIACNTNKSRVNLSQKNNEANRLTHANKKDTFFKDQNIDPTTKSTIASLGSGINNLNSVKHLNSAFLRRSSLTNANDFEIYNAIRSEKRMSL